MEKKYHYEKNIFISISKLKKSEGGIHKGGNLIVAYLGKVFVDGESVRRGHINKLTRLMEAGGVTKVLDRLDGHFEIFLFDKKYKRLYAITDRVSSYPIYYMKNEDEVVFSPEIFAMDISNKKRVNKGAIYEYLSSGHLWGDNTYLKGVKKIGPGQYVKVESSINSTKNWWFKIRFKENKKIDNSTRSKVLYESINSDIKKLPNKNSVLTLSGGLDSRALLAFMVENGYSFDSLSYSYGKDTRSISDVRVAKKYARKKGVPFEEKITSISDGEALVEDIRDVVRATGGESDVSVAQDALLGKSFFENISSNYDVLVRGDEVWGWGDYAFSSTMAFVECLLFAPSELPIMSTFLKRKESKNAMDYFVQRRKQLRREYPSGDSNSLKDFLYWRHRESRLLSNMAYFKRCYITQVNPFLLSNTLAAIQKTTGKERVRKRYFKDMCESYFPELFSNEGEATPYKTGPNKFDILFTVNSFRDFAMEYLVDNPPEVFRSMINIDKICKVLMDDTREKSYDKNDIMYNSKRFINNMLRTSVYGAGFAKILLHKIHKFSFPVNEKAYILRLLTLSVAMRNIERC